MSLQDTINKNKVKSNGGLFETSDEELNSLSQSFGRDASPVNPLSASMLGANPDSAKMAGSGLQKQAALEGAASGNTSLRDTIRTMQGTQETSEAQKAAKQKAEVLKPFTGGLDERVQAIAMSKLGGNDQTVVVPQISQDRVNNLLPTADDATRQSVGAAANKLLSNPGDLAAAKALAQGLGMDVTNLSADQLLAQVNKFMDSEKDQMDLGAGIDDDVTLGELFAEPGAGMLGDPRSIAEALGVDEAALMDMNVPALKAKMDELGIKDFGEVAEIQRRINDPFTSQTERAALQKELAQLGSSGVRATEQDVAKLEEELNSAETVSVGGREYSVTQLLSDANISAMVADYLSDPEMKEKYAGTPLADFIERNRAALTEGVKNLSEGIKSFVDLQAKNRSLGKTANGALIPDDVMKAIFPEWGELSTAEVDVNNPLYRNLKALPAGMQDVLATNLMGTKNPEVVKAVLDMDQGTLQALISSNQLGNWVSFRTKYDEAQSMEPTAAVTAILGRSPDEFKQALAEFQNLKKAGLVNRNYNIPLADVIDANRDGVLDDPKVMKAALLEYYRNSATKPTGGVNPAAELDKLSQLTDQGTDLYGTLKDYVKSDGAFGADDAAKLIASLPAGAGSTETLKKVMQSSAANGPARAAIDNELFSRARTALQGQLTSTYSTEYNNLLTKTPYSGNGTEAAWDLVNKMQPLLKTGSVHENTATRQFMRNTLIQHAPPGLPENVVSRLADYVLAGYPAKAAFDKAVAEARTTTATAGSTGGGRTTSSIYASERTNTR